MSKIAITYGDFDCLNKLHFHLIKEMRKVSLPDNLIGIVLPDDYPVFVNTGHFPIQKMEHRFNNACYLCKAIHQSFSADPSSIFELLISEAKRLGDKLVYVGYDDEKDFPGKKVLQANNIPMKFIKKSKLYGQQETKDN